MSNDRVIVVMAHDGWGEGMECFGVYATMDAAKEAWRNEHETRGAIVTFTEEDGVDGVAVYKEVPPLPAYKELPPLPVRERKQFAAFEEHPIQGREGASEQ